MFLNPLYVYSNKKIVVHCFIAESYIQILAQLGPLIDPCLFDFNSSSSSTYPGILTGAGEVSFGLEVANPLTVIQKWIQPHLLGNFVTDYERSWLVAAARFCVWCLEFALDVPAKLLLTIIRRLPILASPLVVFSNELRKMTSNIKLVETIVPCGPAESSRPVVVFIQPFLLVDDELEFDLFGLCLPTKGKAGHLFVSPAYFDLTQTNVKVWLTFLKETGELLFEKIARRFVVH